MSASVVYSPSQRRSVIKDQLLGLELNFEQVHALLYSNARWPEITCVQDAIVMGEDPQAHDFVATQEAEEAIASTSKLLCAVC